MVSIASDISMNVRATSSSVARRPMTRKKVLCAVDLTPRAQRALSRAAQLADRLDADLTFLHVMTAEELVVRGPSIREQLASDLASSRSPRGREPTIELRAGDYVPTIAAVARETDADLIILGSQRRRPTAPLIGTTAERIVALAGKPALIVNLDASLRYRAVVVAAELSDAFVEVVRVAGLLRMFDGASVSIVHGFESPYRGPLYAEGFDRQAAQRNLDQWERAAKSRLLGKLSSAGVDPSGFRFVFQQAQPMRAIQRVIRGVQPELLIVGTKDRSVLNRIMQGSTTTDLLRTIECDILLAAPDEGSRVSH
jgi:nucleotide-binding universal stress UspA family protein